MGNRLVLISGCSGAGKSTLLTELARRGHAVVEEPGRRIIAEERQGAGTALPWVDARAFAERAVAMALGDLDRASAVPGLVFFDRGLIDAVAALEHATGRPAFPAYAGRRYHRQVFLAPPWPDIYVTDEDRKHGIAQAAAEYERLLITLQTLDYDVRILPKVSVAERADFVLRSLSQPGQLYPQSSS